MSSLWLTPHAAAQNTCGIVDLVYPDHVVRRAGATVLVEISFTFTWDLAWLLMTWLDDADVTNGNAPIFHATATCSPYDCGGKSDVYLAYVQFSQEKHWDVRYSLELNLTKTYNIRVNVDKKLVEGDDWWHPCTGRVSIQVTDEPKITAVSTEEATTTFTVSTAAGGIPGFPLESIFGGLLAGIAVLLIIRYRREHVPNM